jgi:hypothetical protein
VVDETSMLGVLLLRRARVSVGTALSHELPILAAFVVTVLYLLAAHSRLLGIRPMHLLKAITAALSVRSTVAQAVAKGLFADPAQGAVMHEWQKFPAFRRCSPRCCCLARSRWS